MTGPKIYIMNNKKCPSCNKVKLLVDFYKGGGKCKVCQHSYNAIHNKANIDLYRKYQKKANKKSYNRGQDFMDRYKRYCGCQKCGDKRFWILDFHHIDPNTKEHALPYFKSCTLNIIKTEIRKCKVLCRNCHTDFHYQEKQNNINLQQYLNYQN
jgi:hypothetical protein